LPPGIDILKKSFTLSALDEKGEAITNFFTYPCTRKGFEKLVHKIFSLKLKKSEIVIAGLLHSKEVLAGN
jgi:hypothetical protein